MAPVPRIKGRGAYTLDNPGPFGRVGRDIGGLIGGHYGGGPGRAIGEKLGSYAHYLGRIFGSGDYVVSPQAVTSNTLLNSDQVPQFSAPSGWHTMRGFICDITSSSVAGQFQIQKFPINVGMSPTFLWPAELCTSTYQQYEIGGLAFEFKSTSSEYAAGTNLGYIVMATDYDSVDAPFASKQQMENTEFAVSCKPSQCALHAIECARKQTSVPLLYIRSGDPPPNADLRLYDLGQFYIASGGVTPTNVVLGELWYTIRFRLIKPILRNPGASIPFASYSLSLTAPLVGDGSPLIPVATLHKDTIGLTFDPLGTFAYFPATIPVNSIWLVVASWSTNGAGAAAATAPGINLSLFVEYAGFDPVAPYGIVAAPDPSPGAATTRAQSISVFVKYPGGGTISNPPAFGLLPFGGGTTLVTYANAMIYITMVNGGT